MPYFLKVCKCNFFNFLFGRRGHLANKLLKMFMFSYKLGLTILPTIGNVSENRNFKTCLSWNYTACVRDLDMVELGNGGSGLDLGSSQFSLLPQKMILALNWSKVTLKK